MLSALTEVERACRIVYLSSSYNGISAAVRAGIGITGMTVSTKPPRCQVLPDNVGLPPLGQLEVRLHRAPGKPSVALSRLEDYIAGSFATTGNESSGQRYSRLASSGASDFAALRMTSVDLSSMA